MSLDMVFRWTLPGASVFSPSLVRTGVEGVPLILIDQRAALKSSTLCLLSPEVLLYPAASWFHFAIPTVLPLSVWTNSDSQKTRKLHSWRSQQILRSPRKIQETDSELILGPFASVICRRKRSFARLFKIPGQGTLRWHCDADVLILGPDFKVSVEERQRSTISACRELRVFHVFASTFRRWFQMCSCLIREQKTWTNRETNGKTIETFADAHPLTEMGHRSQIKNFLWNASSGVLACLDLTLPNWKKTRTWVWICHYTSPSASNTERISWCENKQAFIAIRSGMYVSKIGFHRRGSWKVIQFKHSLYHSPWDGTEQLNGAAHAGNRVLIQRFFLLSETCTSVWSVWNHLIQKDKLLRIDFKLLKGFLARIPSFAVWQK